MRGRGVDVLGTVFTAGMLCAADPGRQTALMPLSWTVATAGGAALVATAVWQRRLLRPPRAVAAMFIAFLAWLALAAALGDDGRFAWIGIAQRHAGWVLWALCGALFVSGVRWKSVVDGMVVAGVVWLPVLVADAADHPWLDTGTERLTGTFGSAAYLGAAACLVAPAALGVVLDTTRHRWWRSTALVSAASATFAIVGSGSRAAWFASALVGIGSAWRSRSHRPAPRVAAGAAAALVVIVALAAITTPLARRASSVADRDAAGGASRIDEWRVAGRTLWHHPLVGAGPEGYRIVFHDGVDAAYERAHGRSVQPDRAHNGVLDIALAGGVPAAVFYVGFVVAVVVHLRRAPRELPRSPAAAGAMAGLATYLVQQQLLFPVAEVEPVVFLLAGALVCSEPARDRTECRVPARAAATGLALVACVSLWWGVRDIAAWHSAAAAERAAALGDTASAYRFALDATEWRSDEVWLHLLAARSATTPQAALDHVDDALRLSPNDPIALRNRQEVLTSFDPHAALDELTQLLTDDPFNATLHLLHGIAAARIGDEATAEQSWLTALDLAPSAPGPRQNLVTLYRQQGRTAEADALEEVGNQ